MMAIEADMARSVCAASVQVLYYSLVCTVLLVSGLGTFPNWCAAAREVPPVLVGRSNAVQGVIAVVPSRV
jgi:hypothetical protein